jgi:hypothetical protein
VTAPAPVIASAARMLASAQVEAIQARFSSGRGFIPGPNLQKFFAELFFKKATSSFLS